MSAEPIGLPEALERAASALPEVADAIRPANGDPLQLARELSAGGATAVLAWLLEHEPAAGAELALAWADDPETARPVLDLDPAALPKPARKALRRALHHLRSRGVAVPESTPAATVAKLAPLEDAVDEARITALDPHGVRIAYLASARPGGGVRLFEVVFDDVHGVHEFEVFETGRSRARTFLREAARREPWPAVEAPSASVRALVARAATHQDPDRSPPRTFTEWRSRICEVPRDTATPGELCRRAHEPASEADLGPVADWVREGRVGPWPPPIDRLGGCVDRLDEIAKGTLIVSGAARSEQVDRALEEALEEVYDEAQRSRLADAFEENAYVWQQLGRAEDAVLAIAAASCLRDRDSRAQPVIREMLERLLAPALTRAREGTPEGEGAGERSPASS